MRSAASGESHDLPAQGGEPMGALEFRKDATVDSASPVPLNRLGLEKPRLSKAAQIVLPNVTPDLLAVQ
jgi:hypothetical protein